MTDLRDPNPGAPPKTKREVRLDYGVTLEDYRRLEAEDPEGRVNLCWAQFQRPRQREADAPALDGDSLFDQYAARRRERGPARSFPL